MVFFRANIKGQQVLNNLATTGLTQELCFYFMTEKAELKQGKRFV
jgi:hypothetical protein